ncbi:hypothetical protein [Streptomyces sp. AC1-42T]|uniref:hypothetical protein n=1 Tax=Streptomyces sp. AC1-42T TaxID=2218665 RepID=UPI000DAB753D|nr:hypothetical protein [Streptomyces sp. AC1-42T]PZT71416.1 hypothetical protein DNK55_32400 [Streptomyces sp. AC1-42T]
MTYEIRLTDPNGYTVPTAVRYRVADDQREATEKELRDLATEDAAQQRAVLLHNAEGLTGLSAANTRAAADQIRATDYKVQVTPVG